MRLFILNLLIFVSLQAIASQLNVYPLDKANVQNHSVLAEEILHKKLVLEKLSKAKSCLVKEKSEIDRLHQQLESWGKITQLNNAKIELKHLKQQLNQHIKKYNACDSYLYKNIKYKNAYQAYYLTSFNYPPIVIHNYLNNLPKHAGNLNYPPCDIKTTLKKLFSMSHLLEKGVVVCLLLAMLSFFARLKKKSNHLSSDFYQQTILIQRLSMCIITIYLLVALWAFLCFSASSVVFIFIFKMSLIISFILLLMNRFFLCSLCRDFLTKSKLSLLSLFAIANTLFLSLIFHSVPISNVGLGELYILFKISQIVFVLAFLMNFATFYLLVNNKEFLFIYNIKNYVLTLYVLLLGAIINKFGLSFEILTNSFSSVILKFPAVIIISVLLYSLFGLFNSIETIKNIHVRKFCYFMNITKKTKLHEFYIINYISCAFIAVLLTIQVFGGNPGEYLFSEQRLLYLAINPKEIIMSVLVFFITLLVIRVLSGFCFKFINSSDESKNKQNKFRYQLTMNIGFSLATILALWVANISLTAILVILGALSVGIGIGLKSIINNLISGFILIFEKPIRVGDYISIGNYEGVVEKISLRATKIRTLFKYHMYIPNEVLITDLVTNYHVDNHSMSISIPFEIGRSENLEKVKRVIESVLEKQQGLILKDNNGDSTIFIFMRGISSSGLKVRVNVDIEESVLRHKVISNLYEGFIKAFAKEGIEVPYPKNDIRIEKFKS